MAFEAYGNPLGMSKFKNPCGKPENSTNSTDLFNF